jgi:hypothetical protein
MFSGLVRVFVEDEEPELEVDLEKLKKIEERSTARAFTAVAQSLRIALDDTAGPDGRPLSDLARVSVDVKNQVITLVRRTPEETKKWIAEEPIRKARAAKALETKADKKASAE